MAVTAIGCALSRGRPMAGVSPRLATLKRCRSGLLDKPCQGDREGRPYNTKLPVLHVNVYCTGDPRGPYTGRFFGDGLQRCRDKGRRSGREGALCLSSSSAPPCRTGTRPNTFHLSSLNTTIIRLC